MCVFCNVWLCVCEDFVVHWSCLGVGFCCVGVCMCGICNVWVCVCVGFVMCGCVYVWVL